jgi:hypothetical protein
MLSKRPQDRYNTTEDLLVDLRSVAAGEPPRIAREKVGMQDTLMKTLASGERVGPKTEEPPPEPESPFTVNQLTIILLVALAVAILVNILQIVMQ